MVVHGLNKDKFSNNSLVYTALLSLQSWGRVATWGIGWCKVIFISNPSTVNIDFRLFDVRLGFDTNLRRQVTLYIVQKS